MTWALLRLLNTIGSYGDKDGWCDPRQGIMGKRLGIERNAVNKYMRRLCEMGYIMKRNQYRTDGGQRTNLYRLRLDFILPDQFRRWNPEDEDESKTTPPVVTDTTPPVVTDTTPPVVTDTTPPVVTDTTPLNDPLERPIRTTQEERDVHGKSRDVTRRGASGASPAANPVILKSEAPEPEPLAGVAEGERWLLALKHIEPRISPAQFESWYANTQLYRAENDTLVVKCRNGIQASQLRTRFDQVTREGLAAAGCLPEGDVVYSK